MGFLFRSPGFAYNEVVVALIDRPGGAAVLKRFTLVLAALATLAFGIMLVPPVASAWFEQVTGLSPRLAELARRSLWLALPMPALAVLQSWYQGIILDSGRTGSISAAVAFSLTLTGAILVGGVVWQGPAGIYVALAAFSLGEAGRTAWLRLRSRPAWRSASLAPSTGV
jgi:hypothetical protein